jgi:16S rRNA (cytosine967-C5)-methyltransferase
VHESKRANASKLGAHKNPRALALEILTRVDARRSYADRLLDSALEKNDLEPRDRGLVTELVYGTLRWRGRIDWIAAQFLTRPLAGMKPGLLNLLRLTLYQVLFLSKVPEYAAVHEGVELAKLVGGQGAGALVNAVARKILHEQDKIFLPNAEDDLVRHLAVLGSHPEWLVRLWLDYFLPDEVAELLAANNREAPVSIRANCLRVESQRLLDEFEAHGVNAAVSRWSPQGIRLRGGGAVARLPGFREGLFQVQGEASQLVGFLVDPQPGERVLDACAAPGGKATQLAELMGDQGEVIALDASLQGLEKVRENVRRLKLASLKIFRCDVTEGLPENCPRAYDRILVDAPCTGLGTLRSHPEAKWFRQAADSKRLAQLQRKILKSIFPYLKPGGVLVYATCTLAPDENESVVNDFLEREQGMVLDEASAFLPERARTMTRGKYFLALPHKHDTDGFFAARMRKVA